MNYFIRSYSELVTQEVVALYRTYKKRITAMDIEEDDAVSKIDERFYISDYFLKIGPENTIGFEITPNHGPLTDREAFVADENSTKKKIQMDE